MRNYCGPLDEERLQTAAVDGLIDVYQGLASGIHNDVIAATESPHRFPRVHRKPIAYINGKLLATTTELTVAGEVPKYAKAYTDVRSRVYELLLGVSIRDNDFGLLLGTIANLKESHMAETLLSEIRHNAAKSDYQNQRSVLISDAMSKHARRHRNLDARKQLHCNETGFMGAVGIWFAVRGDKHISDYRRMLFDIPLEQTARLPIVERQLLRAEIAGLETPNSEY
jgi:hypothetical protein